MHISWNIVQHVAGCWHYKWWYHIYTIGKVWLIVFFRDMKVTHLPYSAQLPHCDQLTYICFRELSHYLFKVMACHQCGVKPFIKPWRIIVNWTTRNNLSEILIKIHNLPLRKIYSKCRLLNGGHVTKSENVNGSDRLWLIDNYFLRNLHANRWLI